jgi:hypothetical protein
VLRFALESAESATISCLESVLNAISSQSLYQFFSNFSCGLALIGSYIHPISVYFVATDLQLNHCRAQLLELSDEIETNGLDRHVCRYRRPS